MTDFGWGDLLDGGDEGVADGLFSEGASWLLDRTDFTIAAQTPAKDRVRCVDDPVAASEDGADDEDKIILAQVARQELSSNRDQGTFFGCDDAPRNQLTLLYQQPPNVPLCVHRTSRLFLRLHRRLSTARIS